MTVFSTIHELLAGKPADAVAFVGSGCPSLTYGGLREHVERTVARLNRFGVGRNDRIAIVLPNGTEMASAFVAIAAGTTSAPLNPAYRADEFEFYLSDLKAKALVVERGSTSPALGVAAKLKIPVLEIVRASSDPAGVFELVPVEGGETMKDVYNRIVPYYTNSILPELEAGKNVLIVAHGNSLRALVKYLEKLSDEAVSTLEFGTGEVFCYEIDGEGIVTGKTIRATNPEKHKV